MRLLVATHSSHTRGGAERYLGGVLPPLQKMGWEVHLASEDDASGELARLVPTTPSQLNDEVDAADVVLVNGLYSLRFEERLLRRPAVLFAHNYYGTCLSGEKRHRWPSPVCCERALGPACFPLYFARGCGSASAGAGR